MSAIHGAADGTEYGNVHSVKPVALNDPLPPAPDCTAARPLSPCALPSQTLRKQSTWVARPAATARHALITDPSCPGDSIPPDHQPSSSRSASCTSTTPAPLNPGGTLIGPGYVATPSMSLVVRPASSIAARHASSVSSSGSRYRRRPTSDWPAPLMTVSDSGFTRHHRARTGGCTRRPPGRDGAR